MQRLDAGSIILPQVPASLRQVDAGAQQAAVDVGAVAAHARGVEPLAPCMALGLGGYPAIAFPAVEAFLEGAQVALLVGGDAVDQTHRGPVRPRRGARMGIGVGRGSAVRAAGMPPPRAGGRPQGVCGGSLSAASAAAACGGNACKGVWAGRLAPAPVTTVNRSTAPILVRRTPPSWSRSPPTPGGGETSGGAWGRRSPAVARMAATAVSVRTGGTGSAPSVARVVDGVDALARRHKRTAAAGDVAGQRHALGPVVSATRLVRGSGPCAAWRRRVSGCGRLGECRCGPRLARRRRPELVAGASGPAGTGPRMTRRLRLPSRSRPGLPAQCADPLDERR